VLHLRSLVSAVLLLAACSAASLAQNVKFEKYTLDNGMTVILHEDHSLPVCAVNIWYHVGAKDELPGRSGFAHLYEHLMFMGTERVPGNSFDVIMETGGGANNASTSLDRTNYFSSGPAQLLPTLLWLDADRLEDMGRTMSLEKLNLQRDVVRNELRQNVENRPYGKAEEMLYRLMYPVGHPYHNAVYGTHEDLEAAAVGDVTDFFATYYVPNNASLVVAGDFHSAQIKPLIASLFGTLPRGPEPAHKIAPPVRLDRLVRDVTIDDVQAARVSFVYHSPAFYAGGDAEMDLLASVLTSGKTSRLYKRLVFDDKVAVDVSAFQNSAQLGSMFQIDVTAPAGAGGDQLLHIEKVVDEEIARLCKDGLTPAELEQRKAAFEYGRLSQLQSVEARADQLNAYEFYFGDPDSFARDLDRYRKATPESVRDWARRILTPEARVIQWVLPKQPEREADPRDVRPTDLPPASFQPQTPETFTLSNGVNVMFWPKHDVPLVSMRLISRPAGAVNPPDAAGLAELTCQMLGEGTAELDSLAFSDAMDLLGADFSAGVDQQTAAASLSVLARNAAPAVALFADAVRAPRLDPSDFERVKRLHLESLIQDDDQPAVVAARVGMKVLFGDKSPYGWPIEGTPETVEKLTIDDVRRKHAQLFHPEHAAILIAGDLTAESARALLESAFGSWKAAGDAASAAASASVPALPKADALRVVIVDRPEAVQTVVRFFMPGPVQRDERRARLSLLNTLLGGGFTSRLNQNLREKNGYTYGARSRFIMEPSYGYFYAGANVKADVTGPALKEFLAEFARIRAGDVSPEELTKSRETVRTDVIQSFQGLSGIIGAASDLVAGDLPFQTIASDLASLPAVTNTDLNKLSNEAVPLERGVLVLVGDASLIQSQLKGLNLPPAQLLDVRGNPVAAK